MNNQKKILLYISMLALLACDKTSTPSPSSSSNNDRSQIEELETPETNPFDRVYRFDSIELTFDETKANGDCWDPFCGAPDGSVAIYVDDKRLADTKIRQDRFTSSWNLDGPVFKPYSGSRIELRVYDMDALEHDLAFTCSISSLNADHLSEGSIYCSTSGGELLSTFSANE